MISGIDVLSRLLILVGEAHDAKTRSCEVRSISLAILLKVLLYELNYRAFVSSFYHKIFSVPKICSSGSKICPKKSPRLFSTSENIFSDEISYHLNIYPEKKEKLWYNERILRNPSFFYNE